MTWYTNIRQEWIDEMLRIYGFINRQHLMRKFGISRPQATDDLQLYRKNNPRKIKYDSSKKCYVGKGKYAIASARIYQD